MTYKDSGLTGRVCTSTDRGSESSPVMSSVAESLRQTWGRCVWF